MTSSQGLCWEKIILKLRNPFRLSYGVSETRQAFWLRLPNDEGWGEGTIPPYYGVPDEAMVAVWQAAADSNRRLPDDPAEIEGWVGSQGPAPARCALDLALYDRIARQRGLPLYQLLGLPEPQPMPTSFTIAIDTPEAMAQMAAENSHMPIIKVKLGSDDDEARLKAIRAARPDARLRVDANAGWTLEEATRQVQALEVYDLEMIEQPLPKDQIEAMGEVQKHTDLPLVADESVQTLQDVERLAAAGVRGINLKLMKVGGLTPGLRMLRRARELGLQVMLGCMVETSLGTTAMAHLAGLADWLDLDAPLLISNDPFDGVQYSRTLDLSLPERPGIGVKLK
jgi:L-alanine-DL-glutamate epimerase-like enolase superfamily enzyme